MASGVIRALRKSSPFARRMVTGPSGVAGASRVRASGTATETMPFSGVNVASGVSPFSEKTLMVKVPGMSKTPSPDWA